MKPLLVRCFGGDHRIVSVSIFTLVICAFITLCLLWNISENDLTGDGAQYLSVTEQLVAGHGLTTTLYYPSQLAQSLPAHETIFGPGLPLVAAFIAKLFSIDPVMAIGYINVAAHMMTSVLLLLIAAKLRTDPIITATIVIGYAAYPEAWSLALSGMSEPLFMLLVFGVAACLAQVEDGATGTLKYLVGASLLAAAAVLVRYQAIPFVIALGLAVMWFRLGQTNLKMSALAATLSITPASVTFAVLVVRNWQLTGSLRGAPDPGAGNSIGVTTRRLSEAVYDLLGMEAGIVSQAAAAVLIITCTTMFAIRWKNRRQLFSPAEGQSALLIYCMFGLAFNFLLVITLSLSSTNFEVTPRYLLACVPLLIVTLLNLFASRRDDLERTLIASFPKGVLFSFLISICLLLTLSNYRQIRWFEQYSLPRNLNQILAQPYQSGSLRTFLAGGEPRAPILSNQSRALYVVLRRPTIGVPSSRFTNQEITLRNVEQVIDKFKVKYIVIFPKNRVMDGPDILLGLMSKPAKYFEPILIRGDIWIFSVE